LSVTPSARSVGPPSAWWSGISVFWRVQIVVWSLFIIVDMVTNRLLEYSFPVIFYRSAVFVGCYVLFTWRMASFYSSPRFHNRLTPQALAWVALLSLAGAVVLATLLLGIRGFAGWVTPGRNALEDFALPLLHAFTVPRAAD